MLAVCSRKQLRGSEDCNQDMNDCINKISKTRIKHIHPLPCSEDASTWLAILRSLQRDSSCSINGFFLNIWTFNQHDKTQTIHMFLLANRQEPKEF